MARTATGIDIGLRTVKFVRGAYQGNTFHVKAFAVNDVESAEIADAWDHVDPGFKLGSARVGLTGRDVNIRYVRVPRVPDWQLRNLMRFEVEEIGDQSGAGVASDFNLLPQLPDRRRHPRQARGVPADGRAPDRRRRRALSCC